MKNPIFALILISMLTSCSSSIETTEIDIPSRLSKNTAIANSNKIIVNIPQYWKSISDNSETVFDVWFVNPEKNAVIGFVPLSINKDAGMDNDEDAINLLTKFSLESKKSKGADIEIEDVIPTEEINSFFSTSIRYKLDDRNFNSIIFGKDNVYYECLAYFGNAYKPTEEELKKLLDLQTLTISSVKLNK